MASEKQVGCAGGTAQTEPECSRRSTRSVAESGRWANRLVSSDLSCGQVIVGKVSGRG